MRRLISPIVALAAGGLSACGGGGSSGSSVMPPLATPTPPELAVYKNGAPLYVHGYGLRDRGLPDTFAFADMWRVPCRLGSRTVQRSGT